MMIGASLLLSAAAAIVQGDGIRLEFDESMRSRVVETLSAEKILGPYSESETLLTDKGEIRHFTFQRLAQDSFTDTLGTGQRTTLTGVSGAVLKQVDVSAYPGRPRWLFVRVSYRNNNATPINVLGYTSHRYVLTAEPGRPEPSFWSYQGASFESRPDWVLPVPRGYKRENFLGMNDSDYGGGTPLVDVWRRDVGLAVGHLELVPKQVALPVERLQDGSASLALSAKRRVTLSQGESITTLRTFVALHRGDHFASLRAYSAAMQAQG